MDAIKKKMQAMKVEKDNACDRVDVCEEQCKAARVRTISLYFSHSCLVFRCSMTLFPDPCIERRG